MRNPGTAENSLIPKENLPWGGKTSGLLERWSWRCVALEKLLQHGSGLANPPADPIIVGGTKYHQSIVETNSIRKSILERFRSYREVKLIQLPPDRLFEEKPDEHLSRRFGRELNVKRRFVPNEATPVLESEMEGEWGSIEKNHVKSEPAMGESFPDKASVESLLGRIGKLTRCIRSRPPCLVLLKKPLQMPEDLRLACTFMEAKLS